MTDLTWTTQQRKISALKEYEHNPRQIHENDFERLKKSLTDFGYVEIIAVDADNTILAGHMRVRALKKMGHKGLIDVRVPNRPLTDEERKKYVLISNRVGGDWDFDVLGNSWDVDLLFEVGFTPQELHIDIDNLEIDESNSEKNDQDNIEEDEPVEEVSEEQAKSKLGDIYELNDHRIVCGDSTIKEYVDKCLNGNNPILMVTDPPYGVKYDPSWRIGKGGKAGKHIKANGKVKNDDQVNWSLSWSLFPGSIYYVWHASHFGNEVQKSLEDIGIEIKQQIIWVKQNHVLSRSDYHWKHEPCWYAVKKGHNHNWKSDRKQTTVWEIANLSAMGKSQNEDERTNHSTQKPIECMARPIRNNTSIGEGVYDPFLGSGTTLIAAESLGRTCYAIELHPGYVDMSVQRWINYMTKNNKPYTVKLNGEVLEEKRP